ncbi:MAG: tetratricopeptide repeat protein, partial [Planctomycetia bacterium]
WADEGKNLNRAEQMVRKALKIDPANAAYLDSAGWVMFKQGKYADAKKFLQDAIKLDEGNDGVIWDHLGDTLLQLDEKDDARKAWEKSIELYKQKAGGDSEEKWKQIAKKLERLKSAPAEADAKTAP